MTLGVDFCCESGTFCSAADWLTLSLAFEFGFGLRGDREAAGRAGGSSGSSASALLLLVTSEMDSPEMVCRWRGAGTPASLTTRS